MVEGHPLSEAANQLIASMVRKVGGFTFQELNLAIDDIKSTAGRGADLSYDFVNRPAYQHAMATGDTEFLRLTLNTALRHGLQPVSLVHALQNHDELTYELVHFANAHADQIFRFRDADVTGAELATIIRAELIERLTGEAGPYNAIFTTNGIACTTATMIAASLGLTDLSGLNQGWVEKMQRAHLLLAMFNALQPGVFALSGWDLCGLLTLPRNQVSELMTQGDTRWIHRAAYDLMGYCPDAVESASKLPRGTSLYGSLPEQLIDGNSFVSRLRKVLAVRARYRIATSVQVDVPAVSNPGLLVMVHLLDGGSVQLTALNFSQTTITETVTSKHLSTGGGVMDMFTDRMIASVDRTHSFPIVLAAHQGRSLLIVPAPHEAHGTEAGEDATGMAADRRVQRDADRLRPPVEEPVPCRVCQADVYLVPVEVPVRRGREADQIGFVRKCSNSGCPSNSRRMGRRKP